MAAIYDHKTGHTITEGLQGCLITSEAMTIAQRTADERGAAVVLSDDDGDWLVHPVKNNGEREPAYPIND